MDSSQGKGNMMTWSESDWELGLTGRPALERLYDFNALLGARKVVRKFLLHKFAFCDSTGKADLSSAAKALLAAAGDSASSDTGTSKLAAW